MQVNSVNNPSFGAVLGCGCDDLAKRMIKSGRSKKYVDKIMDKAHKLFPGKDFFISYCGYGEETRYGRWVDLSVIKTVKNGRCESAYVAKYRVGSLKDEIQAFLNALKKLRKQDFTKNTYDWRTCSPARTLYID